MAVLMSIIIGRDEVAGYFFKDPAPFGVGFVFSWKQAI
jgi:hypothetical protein